MRLRLGLTLCLLSSIACGAQSPETPRQADQSPQNESESDAILEIACRPDVQAYLGEFLSGVILSTRYSEAPTTAEAVLAVFEEATSAAIEDNSTAPQVLVNQPATLEDIVRQGEWRWVGGFPVGEWTTQAPYSIDFSFSPLFGFRFNLRWTPDQFVPVSVERRFEERACRDLYQAIHFSACQKESELEERLGIQFSDFTIQICRDGGCDFGVAVDFNATYGASELGYHDDIAAAQLRSNTNFDWREFDRQGNDFSITTDYAQNGEIQIYLATLQGTWTGCYPMIRYEAE